MTELIAIAAACAVLPAVGLAGWYAWERGRRRTCAMPGGRCDTVVVPHAQEWELYHNALSLCSKKVRVCLAELRVGYAAHHIDLIETGRYENISRAFLAVNPAGLVPVLIHDGHPIYESHEQIAYAAAHADGAVQLIPDDADERATMARWVRCSSLVGDDPLRDLERSAGNCIPGLTVPLFAAMMPEIPYWRIAEGLLFHRLKQRPLMFVLLKVVGVRGIGRLAPVRTVVHRSGRHLHAHLEALERQLEHSGGPWILGASYSLADVSWMVIFERLAEAGWETIFLTPARPQVAAYWARLRHRPAYHAGIVRHGHPTITRGRARLSAAKETSPALRALYETLAPDAISPAG